MNRVSIYNPMLDLHIYSTSHSSENSARMLSVVTFYNPRPEIYIRDHRCELEDYFRFGCIYDLASHEKEMGTLKSFYEWWFFKRLRCTGVRWPIYKFTSTVEDVNGAWCFRKMIVMQANEWSMPFKNTLIVLVWCPHALAEISAERNACEKKSAEKQLDMVLASEIDLLALVNVRSAHQRHGTVQKWNKKKTFESDCASARVNNPPYVCLCAISYTSRSFVPRHTHPLCLCLFLFFLVLQQ